MTAKKVVAVFFLWASSGCTLAQNFPSKPIRIIVPTIAGSAPDVRVRQIAPKLSDAVGQSVIVDNRPGANGTIATQLAAPYAAFPSDIVKDTDILSITRTWTFTRADQLSTE